jgi:hypothetical protein
MYVHNNKGFANSKWKIYYFQVGGDNLNQFYHSPRAALHQRIYVFDNAYIQHDLRYIPSHKDTRFLTPNNSIIFYSNLPKNISIQSSNWVLSTDQFSNCTTSVEWWSCLWSHAVGAPSWVMTHGPYIPSESNAHINISTTNWLLQLSMWAHWAGLR